MNSPNPDEARGTPRPSPCPFCGRVADNAIIVRSDLTTTATYVCSNAHLYAVTWGEVA